MSTNQILSLFTNTYQPKDDDLEDEMLQESVLSEIESINQHTRTFEDYSDIELRLRNLFSFTKEPQVLDRN